MSDLAHFRSVPIMFLTCLTVLDCSSTALLLLWHPAKVERQHPCKDDYVLHVRTAMHDSLIRGSGGKTVNGFSESVFQGRGQCHCALSLKIAVKALLAMMNSMPFNCTQLNLESRH